MVTAPVSAPKTEAKKETKTVCEDDPAEQSLDDMLDNDDFAKQLAAGMEQLMGQMGGAANAEGNDEMKEAFEKVWASFDGDAAATIAAATATTSAATAAAAPTVPKVSAEKQVPKVPQSFQDTIGKTMNKLKDSSKEINVSNVCVCVWEKKRGYNLLINCIFL